MKRVYVTERQSFLQEKSYEIAQAQQRFNNAFNWYQSKPLKVHLESLKQQHERMSEIVAEIVANHTEEIESNLIEDPDREK